MAFVYFKDGQGNPIGGDKNANPQQGGTTILNYWPVFIGFEGPERLRGVVRVKNTNTGSLNIFGLYDTSTSPTVEFFGDGPANNRVFIQENDELQLVTRKEGNTKVNRVKRLQFSRYPSSQAEKDNVTNEVSNARFVNNTNRLEFKNEFGLTQENFLTEIPNFIALHTFPSPAPYGSYQDAIEKDPNQPETPGPDRELSNARRIQRVKDWLLF